MAGLNQLMGCLVFEITIFVCICLHVHVEPFFITVTLDKRLLLNKHSDWCQSLATRINIETMTTFDYFFFNTCMVSQTLFSIVINLFHAEFQ